MEKKILIIERTYNTPIEKVWQAITNKEQMKQWYFDISDFKSEIGFEFEFIGECGGKKFLHKCKIVEIQPTTKISYTWRYEGYEGDSLVTFELFCEDENTTRLKLTHSGTDSFIHIDFEKADFNEGWKSLLGQSLKDFLQTDSSKNNN